MLSDFVCYIPLASFVEGPEQHRWPQGNMYTIYQVRNTLFRWQLKAYNIWWFQAKQSEIITVCMPCTYIIYDSFNVTETSYVHNANRTLVDHIMQRVHGAISVDIPSGLSDNTLLLVCASICHFLYYAPTIPSVVLKIDARTRSSKLIAVASPLKSKMMSFWGTA